MGKKLTQKEIALTYAKNGIAVFPCGADKSPLVRNGFKHATKDTSKIEEFWDKHPNALIGAPNNQFIVIDIDSADLCTTGKILTDHAINELKKRKIINDEKFNVISQSGGQHYYFKKEDVARSISSLPNIDLLGNGGYVILPDQKRYKCVTSDTPWDEIKKLPKFNFQKYMELAFELEESTKTAKALKKAQKALREAEASANTKNNAKRNKLPEGEKPRHTINYETGEIKFTQQDGMYARGEVKYDIDYQEKLLEKGQIRIDKGQLTSELLAKLYFNQEIQTKLAKFLGITKVPRVNDRVTQRSILPNHLDRRPSLGVRWTANGSHIVMRDFSNHFNDLYNQVDYDIIRMYCTQQYKTLVPRMSGGERNMWFLKMLYESGILVIDDEIKLSYHEEEKHYSEMKPSFIKTAEGYKLLETLKTLYAEFDGTTTFSDRFASGWCGVSPSTIKQAKRYLIENDMLNNMGDYDCTGNNNPKSFYTTKLFAMVQEAQQISNDDAKAEYTTKQQYQLSYLKDISFKTSLKEQAKQALNKLREVMTIFDDTSPPNTNTKEEDLKMSTKNINEKEIRLTIDKIIESCEDDIHMKGENPYWLALEFLDSITELDEKEKNKFLMEKFG